MNILNRNKTPNINQALLSKRVSDFVESYKKLREEHAFYEKGVKIAPDIISQLQIIFTPIPEQPIQSLPVEKA